MLFLPVFLIGILILMLIASLIGALILRFACALFNKWHGEELATPNDRPEFQFDAKRTLTKPDSQKLEDQSPYAPPMAPLTQSNSNGLYIRGVAVPEFGKAFMVCLLGSIAFVGLGIMFMMILGMILQGRHPSFGTIAIQIFTIVGGFFILAAAIKLRLPTSFPRALGVTGIFMLIGLVVLIGIALVVGVATIIIANTTRGVI